MPVTWKSIKEKGKAVAQSVNLPPPVVISGRSLKFVKLLGEGGFALVYLTKDDSENKYALKKCMVQTSEQRTAVQSEIDLLKLLEHPNIIRLVGSDFHDHQVFILMEYAEGSVIGMMQQRHEENRHFSQSEVMRIFHDVTSAVAHMHVQNPPVAHRDLKVENLLVGSDRNYKLCDFGSCTRSAFEPVSSRDVAAAEEELDRTTTLCYRAPEMVDLHSRRRIDERVDIWALGCLLFYLCFFELPFEEQKLSILHGKYTIPRAHEYSKDVEELIRSCLTQDPTQRPDAWTLLKKVCDIRGVSAPSQPSGYTPQPVSIGGFSADPKAGHRKTVSMDATQRPAETTQHKKSGSGGGGGGTFLSSALASALEWTDGA
eukprot:RCo049289